MRRPTPHPAFTFLLSFACVFVFYAGADWPRQVRSQGAVITVYQPQAEAFLGNSLKVRLAFQVGHPAGGSLYGSLAAVARLAGDRLQRQVRILDLQVLEVAFAEAETARATDMEALVRSAAPTWVLPMSMDRLLAGLETAARELPAAQAIAAVVPTVMLAVEPTVLVFIVGEPRTESLASGRLSRVVNTPFFLVYDPRTRDYYVKAGAGYLSAKSLEGPWSAAHTPPSSVTAAALAGGFSPVPPRGEPSAAIRVTTRPAVLLQTDGPPEYAPLPGGSDLLFVKNSHQDIFLDVRRHRYYALVSGRWYATTPPLAEGTWELVPANRLPEAFKRIPEDSEKGHVLAHVAGTRAAAEALLEALIPETTAITPRGPKPAPTYAGEPVFSGIPGADVACAENADLPVFRLAERFYCCSQGVWYAAETPAGPWDVAVSVPRTLRRLPADFPLHFACHAGNYASLGEGVVVGCSPGYLGTAVADGAVVFGSVPGSRRGQVHPPYPLAWGMDAVYHPLTGDWGFRLGVDDPEAWLAAGDRPESDAFSNGGWWGPGGFRAAASGAAAQINSLKRQPRIYNRNRTRERNATTLNGMSLDLFPVWTQRGQPLPTGVESRNDIPEFVVQDALDNDLFADSRGRVIAYREGRWQLRRDGSWDSAFAADDAEAALRTHLERELAARRRGDERTAAFRRAAEVAAAAPQLPPPRQRRP